jgi:hypothetical protein
MGLKTIEHVIIPMKLNQNKSNVTCTKLMKLCFTSHMQEEEEEEEELLRPFENQIE